MLPPKVQLQGKLYSLNPPEESQDISGVNFGYIVTGSEKDYQAAYIVVRVGSTTLSGWTGRKTLSQSEASDKAKRIISAVLPYINLPTTMEEVREKYPYGLKINFYSDKRSGFVKDEFAFYVEDSFSPEDLVKRFVYGGGLTQGKVEVATLKLLARYREWDFNNQHPHAGIEKGEMSYAELLQMSFVPQADLDLALDVMQQEGVVELRSVGQGLSGVKIKAAGIRKVEGVMELEPVTQGRGRTIFYSWQNTVKPNRGYIEESLAEAIKGQPDFSIDSATRNVKGSPDIPETILQKIRDCDIFLADVSIINQGSEGAKVSNPNVMYELGYAAAIKGYENIILVASRETTDTKELPFDIRNKAIVLSNFDKASKQRFVKMLQDELAIHVTEAKSQEPLDHPYIFINGSSIQKPDGLFNVNIYNDETDSYHLDSVELDGSEYRVDRSLNPKTTTSNVNLPGVPVPPYDNRVGMIVLNVSRGSKNYKIKQNINVVDMAIGKFDIGGWEQKPDLILAG